MKNNFEVTTNEQLYSNSHYNNHVVAHKSSTLVEFKYKSSTWVKVLK